MASTPHITIDLLMQAEHDKYLLGLCSLILQELARLHEKLLK